LEEVEQMFNIYGRDGKISLLRIGTLAAAIGVIVVILGVITFLIDRSSHQVPLDIAAYPGAQNTGETPLASTVRQIVYLVPGATPEEVAAYYQQKMDEHYGNRPTDQSREKCQRFPADYDPGIDSPSDYFPEYNEGNEDVPPYRFICLFDRSGLYMTQFTKVTIEPGIPAMHTEGNVVVGYEQHWQP
jgi:hypothetical protein